MKEGYKQTEVGVIPKDWEVKELSEIGETIIGLTYSPSNVREYGTLVLRSSNVQNGKLAFADNVYVDMELPKRVIVKENDILICVRNGSWRLIGKCALIDKKTSGSAFGAFMSIYRSQFSNFVFHQFQSYTIQRQINETLGATINQITNKDLASFQIPLPTITEQNAIATALSDADALINGLEKIIAKKRNIKQGAMQKLLQPKEGWEVKKLGELGEFKNGINKGAEDFGFGYPFVNLMDVFGISKIETNLHLDLINANETERRIYDLKKGDVLFIRSSVKPEGVGLTCLIESNLDNTVFSGFIIRFRENGILSDVFKEYCFSSSHFRNKVIASSSLSANTNINQDSLKNLVLSFPKSIQEQIRIATILSDMDAEIAALENKLEKYRNIKLGMMQNLLTGKIRLV